MINDSVFFSKIIPALDICFDDFHENISPGIVCPWLVRHFDITLMALSFRQAGCSHILDMGCGYGFLSWLLAMEGISITGIDLPDSISLSPYRHSLLRLEGKNYWELLEEVKEDRSYAPFDGILLSWATQGVDPSSVILHINPKVVIYVIETCGLTGDSDGRYITNLLSKYRPAFYWRNPNYRDVGPNLYKAVRTGNIKMARVFKTAHNMVIVFFRGDLISRGNNIYINKACGKAGETITSHINFAPKNPYPWESEMDRYYSEGEIIEEKGEALWAPVFIHNESLFMQYVVSHRKIAGNLL